MLLRLRMRGRRTRPPPCEPRVRSLALSLAGYIVLNARRATDRVTIRNRRKRNRRKSDDKTVDTSSFGVCSRIYARSLDQLFRNCGIIPPDSQFHRHFPPMNISAHLHTSAHTQRETDLNYFAAVINATARCNLLPQLSFASRTSVMAADKTER